jgi:hypothetical protein
VQPPHPVRQQRAGRVVEQRVAAGDDLEHQGAEGEDVRPARGLAASGVLGRDVPARTGYGAVGELECTTAGEQRRIGRRGKESPLDLVGSASGARSTVA